MRRVDASFAEPVVDHLVFAVLVAVSHGRFGQPRGFFERRIITIFVFLVLAPRVEVPNVPGVIGQFAAQGDVVEQRLGRDDVAATEDFLDECVVAGHADLALERIGRSLGHDLRGTEVWGEFPALEQDPGQATVARFIVGGKRISQRGEVTGVAGMERARHEDPKTRIRGVRGEARSVVGGHDVRRGGNAHLGVRKLVLAALILFRDDGLERATSAPVALEESLNKWGLAPYDLLATLQLVICQA